MLIEHETFFFPDCDPRCYEHGTCANGSCRCHGGYYGDHCTLLGCPDNCSQPHGECVQVPLRPIRNRQTPPGNPVWQCVCKPGREGAGCQWATESDCQDNLDNDGDGLVDCADPECCRVEACGTRNQMCTVVMDPVRKLGLLAEEDPAGFLEKYGAIPASFWDRVKFLRIIQKYSKSENFDER